MLRNIALSITVVLTVVMMLGVDAHAQDDAGPGAPPAAPEPATAPAAPAPSSTDAAAAPASPWGALGLAGAGLAGFGLGTAVVASVVLFTEPGTPELHFRRYVELGVATVAVAAGAALLIVDMQE